MIGDEPGHAYNRIQLSPVLGQRKAFSDTVLHDAQWYKARGIRGADGETVTQVDVRARHYHPNAS
jgi:nitrite reductase (NADH) large subunit